MLKFKFNYSNQTLSYQKPFDTEHWYQIPEEQQFAGNFGSLGFKLKDDWITFDIKEKNIRTFYKQTKNGSDPDDFWEPQWVNYFRKWLSKDCPVIPVWF